MVPRLLTVAVLVAGCAAVGLAQQGIPPLNHAKLEKLAEPWPDADALRARRIDAEQRRLFGGTDPFPFTLQADFKAIGKDRNPESKNDYPGLLTVDGPAGPTVLHVQLRPRGHFRRRATMCSFVPVRVEFDKAEAKGTIFDGQKSLKLVVHCNNEDDYEQYILREYAVYRVMNLLTPMSFRARLARVSYVQSKPGDAVHAAGSVKPFTTRFGMFIEDQDDVARRAEARVMDIPRIQFKDLEPDPLSLVMVFEYMISNTDFSIYALHNVKLLRTQDRKIFVVPYDFDLSGLVHTSYAVATSGIGQLTVRDRVYRGPCRPEAEIQPVLDRFREHKDDVLAVYDSLHELDSAYRGEAKQYLQEFFSTIAKENSVRKTFVSGQCSTKPLM